MHQDVKSRMHADACSTSVRDAGNAAPFPNSPRTVERRALAQLSTPFPLVYAYRAASLLAVNQAVNVLPAVPKSQLLLLCAGELRMDCRRAQLVWASNHMLRKNSFDMNV